MSIFLTIPLVIIAWALVPVAVILGLTSITFYKYAIKVAEDVANKPVQEQDVPNNQTATQHIIEQINKCGEADDVTT